LDIVHLFRTGPDLEIDYYYLRCKHCKKEAVGFFKVFSDIPSDDFACKFCGTKQIAIKSTCARFKKVQERHNHA
jgi:hypothetical protein